MLSEFVTEAYIGCATDGGFVLPTCAMLSSLDDNGRVPEAKVVVADFGLAAADREMIRKSAGSLGQRLEFMPLNRQSPEFVAVPSYDFPLPLMGRLVLPREIKTPGARMLLLDSDMIVNRTVRPLFEMSMRGHPIGAVHDPAAVREHWGRAPTHQYFNAGLLLVDLDLFNERDIGGDAMERLAGYASPPPRFLDQDALNEIIETDWLALDRRWNYFHAADQRYFTTDDYADANVIHFAGPKPWLGHDHPAGPIYFDHSRRVAEKIIWRPGERRGVVNRVFAAACYEVLLGRDLTHEAITPERLRLTTSEFVGGVIASSEFRTSVVGPVSRGEPMPANRFTGRPSVGQRFWAIDRLPVLAGTAARMERATSWRELLVPLIEDRYFMSLGRQSPVRMMPSPKPRAAMLNGSGPSTPAPLADERPLPTRERMAITTTPEPTSIGRPPEPVSTAPERRPRRAR